MKRYWKIISLCIVMVIVIGSFYIQSSLATQEKVKIEFEKVSGNEDEVKNLILQANYAVGNLHQSLQVSVKETINLNNQSPLQKLTQINASPVIKELVENYRSFMRGKDLSANNFYEDENLLVYASIMESYRNPSFDIEVLNKKSEETTPIQLELPPNDNYGWLDVVEVQAIGGKLKVFARGFRTDGGVDLNVYTFDIDEQELVNNELLLSELTVENGWSHLSIINDFYSTKPEKYLLIKMNVYKNVEEFNVQNNGRPEIVSHEVIVYNIEQNQSQKLNIPDEMLDSLDSSTISDSTIFIPSQLESGYEVSQYDIETEKWGNKIAFDLPDTKNGHNSPFMKLMNGKIYLIHSTGNDYSILISDLTTGESLYEGKLKVKNTDGDQKHDRLYIYDMEYVQ